MDIYDTEIPILYQTYRVRISAETWIIVCGTLYWFDSSPPVSVIVCRCIVGVESIKSRNQNQINNLYCIHTMIISLYVKIRIEWLYIYFLFDVWRYCNSVIVVVIVVVMLRRLFDFPPYVVRLSNKMEQKQGDCSFMGGGTIRNRIGLCILWLFVVVAVVSWPEWMVLVSPRTFSVQACSFAQHTIMSRLSRSLFIIYSSIAG